MVLEAMEVVVEVEVEVVKDMVLAVGMVEEEVVGVAVVLLMAMVVLLMEVVEEVVKELVMVLVVVDMEEVVAMVEERAMVLVAVDMVLAFQQLRVAAVSLPFNSATAVCLPLALPKPPSDQIIARKKDEQGQDI